VTDILGGLSLDELEQIQQLTLHSGASLSALLRLREATLRAATAKIQALRDNRAAPGWLQRGDKLAWERRNAELHGLDLAAMEINPDTPQAQCPYCHRDMPQHGLHEHIAITHAGRPR
jgi:hypothetical protein